MSESELKNLKQFLAGYFHQDFNVDGTPDEIIGLTSKMPQRKHLQKCLRKSTSWARSLDEASLETLVAFKLYCAYDPTACDGWTYASWLRHVEESIAGSWDKKTDK